MPVTFYPDKPIAMLEKYLTKDNGEPLHGEIDIYKKIQTDCSASDKVWYVWHDLRLPFHSNTLNPYNKTSAQIDFLILSEHGLIVLEVKGGNISFHGHRFYYGNEANTEMDQNPFYQAEGYKFTLKDKVLNIGSTCLICHAVAFPHAYNEFDTRVTEPQLLWTAKSSPHYNSSIEEFFLSVYGYNRSKHSRYRDFLSLSERELKNVHDLISPIIDGISPYYNTNTHEWLKVNNLEILEGLDRNDRIMIEGGPGTGKTTTAKAFIDSQITKKGLYLCWNNLLMHSIKHLFKERGLLKTCEVNTLTRFILELAPQTEPQQLIEYSESEFYSFVDQVLQENMGSGKLPHYDFIVVDEGQDVFDRGIDLVINELTGKEGKGIFSGKCLILYDIDQSYFGEGRQLVEMTDLLKDQFAHFKLNENKRSAQAPEIKEFARKIISTDNYIPAKPLPILSTNVSIHEFGSLKDIKDHIVSNVLSRIRSESDPVKGKNSVLLIESSLLKDKYGEEPGMDYWLTIRDVEELTDKNIGDTGNILRYTSILKYKGLEKEHVFLLVSTPREFNKYEMYVGITRAISNLEVMIMKN